MFNFNLKFTKKIPFYELMVIGSFYKISAMEDKKISAMNDKKKNILEKKITMDIFKIEEYYTNINSINNNKTTSINSINNNKCFKVEYDTNNKVSTFNGAVFWNTYSSYLNLNSNFLYVDDFTFFSMFNNLLCLYDVTNNVNNKHFYNFHQIYGSMFIILNKIIKLYKTDEIVKLNSVSFTSYVNEKKLDLFKKIKFDKPIEEKYFLSIWERINNFFDAFSKFIFIKKIGYGGMGFVLECIKGQIEEYNGKEILTFSGPYACKFTLNDLLEKEEVPNSFKHENIVKIIESRSLKPLGYVLMPKYPGSLFTIAKFYNQYPTLRKYKFLNRISFQMFDVLKHLRGKYFHNDIKLENLLLDDKDNVIFIDFSIGYNADVEYSKIYNRCTYQYCSKHILEKINKLEIINRVNLLKFYEDNKNKFLNSKVFKNNFSSEQDFDKLSEDEKYEFLIINIEKFGFEINFKKRKMCIADICDMRSGIEPSTDILDSIDINGIKYPNKTLCRDNLYKADYYAVALVIHLLFNGLKDFKGIRNITDILEKYDNGTLKIDYDNKYMDPKLRLMLRLIADPNFFSRADSLKQFDEKVKNYEKNKKNRKNAVKKRLLKKIKKQNTSVKKNDAKLSKDCNQESFYDNILPNIKK